MLHLKIEDIMCLLNWFTVLHYKHILRKSHVLQNVGRKLNSAHCVGYNASIKEHIIINRRKNKVIHYKTEGEPIKFRFPK